MNSLTYVKEFADPSYEYAPMPFWFWNDDLKEEHLRFQIQEMYDKGIREFLIHARFGLSVPYLSEEWFCKIAFALDEAKKLGMRVWLYDEENWPSGYAGGRVLAEDSSHCGKYLARAAKGEVVPADYLKVGEDDDFIYYQGYCRYHPAYSDDYYVDMLSRRSTEAFIRSTHEEYYKRFASFFGNVIRGFFVDEPGFYNNFEMYAYCPDPDTYVWTTGFADEFYRQMGYDITGHLGALWSQDREQLRYKLDYYKVVVRMYRENFLGVLRSYCHEKGILLIGHLHSEEFLPYHVKTQGDLISCLQELDWSGVDRIDTNPEKITEKYGSSAAHIYNKKRTMSETFCLSGWDLNPMRMRQWTNWQYVRGVNCTVLHAFYSSIEGDRKWECPPTLFFQNYYWKYFKRYADWNRRLSFALTEGQYTASCAVYYPITTQQELVQGNDISEATRRDAQFIDICNQLSDYQIDYDILNDEAVAKAYVQDRKLHLNGIQYSFILLHALSNIPAETLRAVAAFARAGGGVVYVGKWDFSVVGMEKEEEKILKDTIAASSCFFHINEFSDHKPYVYSFCGNRIADYARVNGYTSVKLQKHMPGIKCMRRKLDDGSIYYFINEEENERLVKVTVPECGDAYRLDVQTGKVFKLESKSCSEGTQIELNFDPYGEYLILLTQSKDISAPLEHSRVESYSVQLISSKDWKLSGGNLKGKWPLLSWGDLGYPNFSGAVSYEKTIEVEKIEEKRYYLDLGDVYHTAEVWLNDAHIDDLIWAPYRIEITDHLLHGKNKFKIVVSNTLGNEIEKRDYLSGMLGPVRIIITDKNVS